MSESQPPEVVDEDGLYMVAPEQFIAARDALVKRLRSSGDKPGAARVAKLRRLPLTVWVLNQVSRATPSVIDALLGAGSELRAAMERALDGDASGLRQARDEERAAVGAVVSAAEHRLSEEGYVATDVIRQRVATTLRAAIVDEAVAARLRLGTLDQDHDAPGFGMDALSAPLSLVRSPDRLPPQSEQLQPDPAAEEREGNEEEARRSDQERARRRQEAHQEADRLQAEANRLTAEAERLAGQAQRLAEEAQQRAAEAQEAERRAADARGRAEDARRAAAAGRAQADRLTTS